MKKYVSEDKGQQKQLEIKQQQNHNLFQLNKSIIKRRYINKKQKNRLQSIIVIKSSEEWQTVSQENKDLKVFKQERSSLKVRCRQIIKDLRQVLPIIGEQNVQFIERKGKQRIPVVEDLVNYELRKIFSRICIKKQRLFKIHGSNNPKIMYNKEDDENISIQGTEQCLKSKVEISQLQENDPSVVNKVVNKQFYEQNIRIKSVKEQNQYLQQIIDFLKGVFSVWKKKLSKTEFCEAQAELHLSEQENQKIKALKLLYNQLTFQNKGLKLQYLELLEKAEDMLPFIIEDQKNKSKHERIEIKVPQSARLVHYVTLPLSSKDIYDESARIRNRLHQQFKKEMKMSQMSQSVQSQVDKARINIQKTIKISQFRKEYFRSIIAKLKNYLGYDSPQVIPQQFQIQEVSSGQIKEVNSQLMSLLDQSIKNKPLEDKKDVQFSKDVSSEKNSNQDVLFSLQKEQATSKQILSLLRALQIQKQKLKSQYLTIVNKAEIAGAPFFNEKDIFCIQLKGSKNQKNTKIYTSKNSFQLQVNRLDYYLSRRQIKQINKNRKNQQKSLSSSDPQFQMYKYQFDKQAFKLWIKRQSNTILRRSVKAIEQYLCQWMQIKQRSHIINSQVIHSIQFIQ